MNTHLNAMGQPIGAPLPDWQPCPMPGGNRLQGRFCCLEALDIKQHAAALFAALAEDSEGRGWTYLAYGPFADLAEFSDWLQAECLGADPLFYTIIDLVSGQAVGMTALMRLQPQHGSIEVGHVHFSPRMKQTAIATEAMALLMAYAFDDLGYRRYEWKCDSLNQSSKKAAIRLGFEYEGTFRQAVVYNGRNRDTAWFSILDSEWPQQKVRFRQWLQEDNFTQSGQQIQPLQRPAKRSAENPVNDGGGV